MAPSEQLPMWFAPVERTQLFEVLRGLAPQRCLEWGTGGSTLEILLRCPSIESYLAIEHDGAWVQRVRGLVADPRLSLHHVAANQPFSGAASSEAARIAWSVAAEEDETFLADYVQLPTRLDRRFDFVLVDGRARRFCMREGFERLDPGGLLALHDAQRPVYHDVLTSLGPVEFLNPWTQGQLAIVRKL